MTRWWLTHIDQMTRKPRRKPKIAFEFSLSRCQRLSPGSVSPPSSTSGSTSNVMAIATVASLKLTIRSNPRSVRTREACHARAGQITHLTIG